MPITTILLRQLLQSPAFAHHLVAKIHPADWVPLQAPIALSSAEHYRAINLAGSYALISGTPWLAWQYRITAVEVWQRLVDDAFSSFDLQLLCRLANTTWKVTQPYRSLKRIERDSFIPFSMLSEREKTKDLVQIKAAANCWMHLAGSQGLAQHKAADAWVERHLFDPTTGDGIARILEEAYYTAQNLAAPAVADATSDQQPIIQQKWHWQTAAAMVPWLALEGWLDYAIETWGETITNARLAALATSCESEEEFPMLHEFSHAALLASMAFYPVFFSAAEMANHFQDVRRELRLQALRLGISTVAKVLLAYDAGETGPYGGY